MRGWRIAAYRAVRPLLFLVEPERIHHLALRALGSRVGRSLAPLASGVSAADAGRSPVEVAGVRFRNRIGLAAGFDKDGVAIRGWAALGFGFVELGTVTPQPQEGNPRPRLYRLPADEALINRMGFNNAGADALARRIADARPHLPEGFAVGVNIGRNRDGGVDDYPAVARTVAEVADYLAVNVSSPNTPGLRDLQDPATLRDLLAAVAAAATGRPILVKLAPDLCEDDRAELVRTVASSSAAGVILSNTTIARSGLRSRGADEPGGLSGRPLRSGTLAAVAAARRDGPSDLVVVGSGGVGDGADAAALLDAGADLVELWTGLITAGPGLIGEAVRASGGR
jgi:dihydroorotate dehydrogenase